jgi:hypothetical protein
VGYKKLPLCEDPIKNHLAGYAPTERIFVQVDETPKFQNNQPQKDRSQTYRLGMISEAYRAGVEREKRKNSPRYRKGSRV